MHTAPGRPPPGWVGFTSPQFRKSPEQRGELPRRWSQQLGGFFLVSLTLVPRPLMLAPGPEPLLIAKQQVRKSKSEGTQAWEGGKPGKCGQTEELDGLG